MLATPSHSEPNRMVRLLWWTLFGTAFGCIEAAVVVYLRQMLRMPPGLDYRVFLEGQGVLFQSHAIQDFLRQHDLLKTELCREAATLLLLFGAAWAAGRTSRERWGIFGYTFAIWDLTYYLFLALWIGFPRSLADTDIYFLIPIAWYGPVWFPVLVVMPAIVVLSLRLMSPAPAKTVRQPETRAAMLDL